MPSFAEKTFTLNDGTKIPALGLGCWMSAPGGGQRVADMCAIAIKYGCRHIDTAALYMNEEEVRKGIQASGIPREELYIATKISWSDTHRVAEAVDEALARLGLHYIDLYMIHFPQAIVDGVTLPPDVSPTYVETYLEMEKLLSTGKVKSIGVSNFSIKTLSHLLEKCSVVPAINQVEMHPCLPQHELKKYCESKGILVTAYSPLGQQNTQLLFGDSTVQSISQRLGITPAQVLLSWGVQRGTAVVFKTENEERMQSNSMLFTLSNEDMKLLDNVHRKPGMHRSLTIYHAPDGTAYGWTYEQLGWNMTTGGIVPQ